MLARALAEDGDDSWGGGLSVPTWSPRSGKTRQSKSTSCISAKEEKSGKIGTLVDSGIQVYIGVVGMAMYIAEGMTICTSHETWGVLVIYTNYTLNHRLLAHSVFCHRRY